ncbi:hypothetical protein TcWFU_006035 [Taenia crassiceps]|uniref:Uncharacterized protein n=1 Tax=Taenia crassiceps TaxID=6207 RepID=A0ABR4QT47_9CEST
MKICSRLLKNRTSPLGFLGYVRSTDLKYCLDLVKLGHLASSADQLDLRLALQVWKFVSQILASFHVQIKEIFLVDFHICTELPLSDEFILSMLLANKRLFGECIVDTEKCLSAQVDEPLWRGKLKLIAFICRLLVGCVQHFQSVLFMTTEKCQHRRVVDFISWTLEVQYAGGLFPAGTGLEQNFLKEVSTSLFVAAEMTLSCVSQIEPKPGLSISAAVNAIVLANLTPLINCRIFASILVNLSKRRDLRAFSMWFSDEFNVYAEFFTNLEAAFALWKPHESTPNPSDFHIPRFLNLIIDHKQLSSAVEQFLTAITIEVCKSVRHLPNEIFHYLESALLETTLHASPVISIVAQDIWCFVVRYGSAELCWQYVTLLGNTVLCLAERYSSSISVAPLFEAHPPLEQMSRLGCLLSRFLVFLTARQQRDFLSTFPIFDSLSSGATEKSLLWRFLLLRKNAFQLSTSIRPLLERQIIERANQLLRSRPALSTFGAAADWLLDALTCLRLTEDLALSTLAPYAAVLSRLTAAILTFDDTEVATIGDEDVAPPMVAPPYLLHLTDPSARLQIILSLIAHWLPRHLLRLASEQSHSECRQLLQVLFAQIRTYCRDGIGLAALNAISCWLLACTSAKSEHVTTLSAFSLASSQSPPNSSSSPLSPTIAQILSTLWSPLCQTGLTGDCELIRGIAERVKDKLAELCPDVGQEKRSRQSECCSSIIDGATMDAHLETLAETIEKLEALSGAFTSAHCERGRSLTRRLDALFPLSGQ